MLEFETKSRPVVIRDEMPADFDAITEVTIEAFKTLEVSCNTEQFIIKALREADVLTVSLVAELEGRIRGHIAFSPITISDSTIGWYGLGPVSVWPDFQKQGIGKTLINQGLARLKDMGGRGCALVGDPNYYKRFGFRNEPGLVHEGIPQEYFLVLPFTQDIPQGVVGFHEAFLATS
jgi:putative acetyltransferase